MGLREFVELFDKNEVKTYASVGPAQELVNVNVDPKRHMIH